VENPVYPRAVLCRFASLLLLALALLLTACGTNYRYQYRYVEGKTATLVDGQAVAPEDAPDKVHAAIAAANSIAGSPYARGGGHGGRSDGCFDCSGATSFVLRNAGLLRTDMPSASFRKYGRSGDEDDWISVWARKGHVFLVVAGLRFDTGWHGQEEGPRWTTKSRPAKGYVIRQPSGL
jgi:hypothetical protein